MDDRSKKPDGMFTVQMGPAFFAVVISILISLAQFAYSQGQQSTTSENTKKATDKLEQVVRKFDDKQNNFVERVVKVETIASTIQAEITAISAKLDRIAAGTKLDKN